jgi:hypothetical protein
MYLFQIKPLLGSASESGCSQLPVFGKRLCQKRAIFKKLIQGIYEGHLRIDSGGEKGSVRGMVLWQYSAHRTQVDERFSQQEIKVARILSDI